MIRSTVAPGTASLYTRHSLRPSAPGVSSSWSRSKVISGEVILRRTIGHSSRIRYPSRSTDSQRIGVTVSGSNVTSRGSKW